MMLFRRLFVLMTLLSSVFSFHVRAQSQTAEDFVTKLSEDVLQSIQADKDLLAGNQKKLKALVDNKVAPYLNMTKLTANTVGRPWREASADQQKVLTEEYRTLLLKTYASAMHRAKGAKITIRPSKSVDDSDVVVRTKISNTGGDPIDVHYRLEKKDGGWMIYDVSVLGAWLSQSYSGTFSSEIQKGGVAGLIKTLKEKNKQ
jgi:phospholipid transport system substrate-binding protein